MKTNFYKKTMTFHEIYSRISMKNGRLCMKTFYEMGDRFSMSKIPMQNADFSDIVVCIYKYLFKRLTFLWGKMQNFVVNGKSLYYLCIIFYGKRIKSCQLLLVSFNRRRKRQQEEQDSSGKAGKGRK